MIRVGRDGVVVTVSLDRPEQRNALTPEMFDLLHARLDDVLAGSGTGALVLTGEGRVFCGGFDLRLCLAEEGTLERLLHGLHRTIERVSALSIPVVVAAHGAAIAGGCALLACGDVVVTNDEAKLGYPVTPLGISPAVSAPFLREAIGGGACRGRLLDPGLISGREAVRIGLAHVSVAGAEAVREEAVRIAAELAAKPREAFSATKAWLREIGEHGAPPGARENGLRASLGIAGREEERERLQRLLMPQK